MQLFSLKEAAGLLASSSALWMLRLPDWEAAGYRVRMLPSKPGRFTSDSGGSRATSRDRTPSFLQIAWPEALFGGNQTKKNGRHV